MKNSTLICFMLFTTAAFTQTKASKVEMSLRPYRMLGQNNTLRKNLTFGEYKTQQMRRTLGSFFYYQAPSLANMAKVDDIPLYNRDRLRAKDVFRFDLESGGKLAVTTECRAVLRTDETFKIFSKQDSSFFGARNTDVLEARMRLAADTSQLWRMLASNLNGTKDEEQKGIIRNARQEIRFIKTNLLLRELMVKDGNPLSNLASLNLVYAFSFEDRVVAAVSVKVEGRQFWIDEDLNQPLKDIIAAAASVLTFRKDLYH